MEDEIDALFKLPLGEFTPARNALAARLKKAGEGGRSLSESAVNAEDAQPSGHARAPRSAT